MPIDFPSLARDLRERARDLLPGWLPAGRFRGREFVVGSIAGEEGDSLSINWTTGQWADFATGIKGSDLISLFAAMQGVKNGEAARLLGAGEYPRNAGPTDAKISKSRADVIAPAPKKAGIPSCVKYPNISADGVWVYYDAVGAVLGAVARYNDPCTIEIESGVEIFLSNGGKRSAKRPKSFMPWTWRVDKAGKTSWRPGTWDKPRPMYGLDELAKPERAKSAVVICEGEKAADAAGAIMPQYIRMSWPHGTDGINHVDWSPLKGRRILLWPDNDTPGIDAMWKLGYKLLRLCPEVKIIIPEQDVPAKWDAADALIEWETPGITQDAMWARFKEWAVPQTTELREDFSNEAKDKSGRDAEAVEIRDAPEKPVCDNPAASADPEAGSVEPVAKPARKPREKNAKALAVERVSDAGIQSQHHKPAVRKKREVYWSDWCFDMMGNGYPIDNLNNAIKVLENDPEWAGKIWYDTFLQRIVSNLPGADGVVAPREWTDFDDINLQVYMQATVGLRKISTDTVGKAVVRVARGNLKHCVVDWLETLKWDETVRLESFFTDYFGAKNTAFTRAVSRNFWMSIVARAYMPGCKCDYMVVLEGAQGMKKSMAIEAVASSPWFSVALEDIDGKDFFQTLRAKLIVEIGELEAFNRRGDMNRVKNVVSCATDNYRGSYERHAVDHPRQCIFCGTTNREDWNKDETGARRFWPIRTHGEIDIEGILATREQYYAEAVARLKRVPFSASAGARMAADADWWQVPTLEAQEEQEERFDEDSWKDTIEDFVALKTEVRMAEILVDGLKIDIGKVKRAEEMRAAAVLRSLGWEHKLVKRAGSVSRFWVKNHVSKF